MSENLTADQRNKHTWRHTNIFNAYLYANYGGKHMVQALWQTGITWAPPHIGDDNGAAEHIARCCKCFSK